MGKHPKPLKSDDILERHAALGCTEVALVMDGRDDAGLPWYKVELITAKEDGSYERHMLHSGCSAQNIKHIRLMDFFSGVIAAQRSIGMKLNKRFVEAVAALSYERNKRMGLA